MDEPVTNRRLIRQLKPYFPDRWKVTKIQSRVEGQDVLGTIRIHCLEDDKFFLSDFSARLDRSGQITNLSLDGVKVGVFVGRMHEG